MLEVCVCDVAMDMEVRVVIEQKYKVDRDGISSTK